MYEVNHQESDVPRPASPWGCGADGRAVALGDRVAAVADSARGTYAGGHGYKVPFGNESIISDYCLNWRGRRPEPYCDFQSTRLACSPRLEPPPGLLQVRRLKPFGEPAVDRGQYLPGVVALALLLPQPTQAQRGA